MKVGVYVGSFNPVHKGHINIVNYLLKNKILDKIIIIPTKSYWKKNNLVNIKNRINMLKYYENDQIIIDTKLNSYKYTYQILNELKKYYNDLYLIIGDDNLINFDKWKNVDEILLNKVIVVKREILDPYVYINRFNKKDSFILIENYESINISSTNIRKLILEKKYNELNKLLDSDIIEYILKNNLYEGFNE
ncbi:MAG: nicotinate-nicotinamide nucleotide adenylyltransferase [Bacilli bacterium]|nr:nicotinate-nicotinamide nucleotide adenylyltransferase [Bacilli bacterium]MDD4831369.1 nicotinate-nicotinamide nucleotide adenylyltransferase [Bacilli bacterium]